jgi:hypothetical protein
MRQASHPTTILVGDVRTRLADIMDGTIQTCVTSPPYYCLRDYGVDGQIGLEPTPEAFVAELVTVFREVRRCLRDDGTLWLNIGDSYRGNSARVAEHRGIRADRDQGGMGADRSHVTWGVKPGDLLGIPWMLAFALRADGWWLRSDVTVLFPSAMAISEANACGHPELASKVRDNFTALASDAGLASDWADTHLSDENGRCCAHSASRCDEADLKEQMHYIEDFTRQAQTAIQGNK